MRCTIWILFFFRLWSFHQSAIRKSNKNRNGMGSSADIFTAVADQGHGLWTTLTDQCRSTFQCDPTESFICLLRSMDIPAYGQRNPTTLEIIGQETISGWPSTSFTVFSGYVASSCYKASTFYGLYLWKGKYMLFCLVKLSGSIRQRSEDKPSHSAKEVLNS